MSTLTVLTVLCRCLPKFTGTILVVVVGKQIFFTYLSADLFLYALVIKWTKHRCKLLYFCRKWEIV